MGDKSGFYAGLVLAVLVLCGCETLELETQIDHGVYDVYQIVDKTQPLIKKDYILDSFTLSYIEGVKYKENRDRDEIETHKFIFYADDIEVCKVEITEKTRPVTMQEDGVFAMLRLNSYEKYVEFIYGKDSSIVPIQRDVGPAETYATFETSQNEIVTIVKYYNYTHKGDFYSSGYLTGLEILVNNERYGILAFYPLAFHLEKGKQLEKDIALYILTTYVSQLYGMHK